MTTERGDDVVKMRLRIGQVTLAVCAMVAALSLAPVASAGAAISGTVTNTSAQPLENIEVCAVKDTPVGSTGGGCTATDTAGEYSLPGAGAGYKVQFYSRPHLVPGYAPQWYPGKAHSNEAEGVAAADLTHVDAVMSRGGTVTGTVRSTQGSTPIQGVEVCPDRVIFRDHEESWCDKTDANGEFALGGLGTEEYRFEFTTEGEVNYVGTITSPHLVQAGTEAILEDHLVPGVMVKGTVTEAGTGLPVEGLGAPYSTPSICALAAGTEERIKCTTVRLGGNFSLPGLPPGKTFGLVFALDWVEAGFDLHPDGYVRQYWDEVPSWGEAALIFGSGGSTFAGITATLTRGAEVFPHCEVVSACPPGPPLPLEPQPETPTTVVTPPPAAPVLPPLLSGSTLHCKPGFRKVTSPRTRCVKIQKKHKHRKHHPHRKALDHLDEHRVPTPVP